MMNLLQVQDDLKNFSQDQLVKEMQQPSGSTPQFLVLSELNRRKRVKGDFEARQAQQQPTVAEEAVASAGVPQQGMMGMPEAMAPKSAVSEGVGTSAPMKMASGGLAQFGNEIRNSMGQEIDPYLDGVQQEAEQKFNIDLDNNMERVPPMMAQPRPAFPMLRPGYRGPPPQIGFGGKGQAVAEPAVISDMRARIRPSIDFSPAISSERLSNTPFGGQSRRFAEGGVVRAANGLSLADRNMNPGNIRPAGFMGETGVNKGYSTYASPEFGLRAMSRLSDTYASKGIGTIRDYINRYAPPSDNNENNEAYANMVANALGVGIDDPVDFTDDNVKRAIMPAMAQFEGYKGDLGEDLINKGIAASKTDDVTKANDLLAGVDSFDSSNLFGVNKRKVSGTTTSNVPKGVRPDFNINSVPKNMREKKYLEKLKKEQSIGKEQKRPILSDIINKEIEKEKKNPEPSLIDQILSPDDEIYNIRGVKEQPSIVGDDPSGEIESMDYGPAGLKRPELGIFGNLGKALGGKRFGQPGEILNEAPYGSTLRPFDAEDEKLGDKSSIPLGAGASYEEFLKKNFPEDYKKQFEDKINIFKSDPKITTDAQNVLEENAAMIGDVNEQVMNLSGKVTGSKEPIPTSAKDDKSGTALTSLEQELLNRQKQLQKDRDFDKYMALAQAGLSIMSSDKPTLAGAIGEGGTAGLEAFRGAQKRYQEGLNDILNARVKLANKKGGLTQKEAISSIASIDSAIAKYRTDADKAVDPSAIKKIQDAIAQLNFQKRSLMPIAGYSYLNTDVSDSAAAKG